MLFHHLLRYTFAVLSGLSNSAKGAQSDVRKQVSGACLRELLDVYKRQLWGGVVGDDGVQNLILGRDHPVGEAFLDFQRYVKDLQRRGIILAV